MNNKERLIKLVNDVDGGEGGGERWENIFPEEAEQIADAIIKDGWIPIGETEIDIEYAATYPLIMGDKDGIQRTRAMSAEDAEQEVAFVNGRAVSHGFEPLAKVQRRLVIRGPWSDVE